MQCATGSIDSYDFVCRCIGEQRRAVSIDNAVQADLNQRWPAGFWYQLI
jgi:hypothetical protein